MRKIGFWERKLGVLFWICLVWDVSKLFKWRNEVRSYDWVWNLEKFLLEIKIWVDGIKMVIKVKNWLCLRGDSVNKDKEFKIEVWVILGEDYD